MWAVLLLRPYLEGTIFTIRTDHDALKCIHIPSDAIDMLVRWLLRVTEFDFDAVHFADIRNQATVSFSRLETKWEDNTGINDEIQVAITQFDGDINEATKVSIYKVCHICDEKNHKARTSLPNVQDLVGQEDSRLDRPPSSEQCTATQTQDLTCLQHVVTIGHRKSKIKIDGNGLSVTQPAIGSAIQTVVQKVF